MKRLVLGLALLFGTLIGHSAFAQAPVAPCVTIPGGSSSPKCLNVTATNPLPVTTVSGSGVESAIIVPTGVSTAAIVPSVSSVSTTGNVFKTSAGNLYSVAVTTGTTSGYVLLLDRATVPAAGGAAVTPVYCVVAPANSTVNMNWAPGPMARFATGIVALFSTTGCLTYTADKALLFTGMYQ